MRQAMAHLAALGHVRCAFLSGPRRSWSNQQRLRGLRAAARAADAEIVTIGPVAPQFQGGVDAAEQVLASGATAVLAYNDLVAAGILSRLAQLGVDVPGELSVVGFDDIPLAAMLTPALTTVAAPTVQAGAAAVEALLGAIDPSAPRTAHRPAAAGDARGARLHRAAGRAADGRASSQDQPRSRVMRQLTTAGDETAHINLALADLSPGEALELPAGGRDRRGGHERRRRRVHRGRRVPRPRGRTCLRVRRARRHRLRAGGDRPAPDRRTRRPGAGGRRLRRGRAVRRRAARRASSAPPSSGSPRSARATGRARCARSSAPSTTRSGCCWARRSTRPGNWSSYPPHRHDRHNPPEEVDLEEVYLFKTNPAGGFGVQIRYELDGDRAEEAFLVRDDDIAVIRSGFHPVVAASD